MNAVTGGAGFIGSHLVDALHRSDREVRVLDALISRPADPGDRLRRRAARFPQSVELIEGDVRDREALRRLLPGCKRVFHLAGFVGVNPSTAEPGQCLEINVQGTAVLLEEMQRADVPQLVLVSTAAVYGPLHDGRPNVETRALRPMSTYGASMAAAEALAFSWQAQTGGHLTVLRPFNVYGPRMRPDSAMYRLLTSVCTGQSAVLFGDGHTTRDFVHVTDVLRALAAARGLRSRDPVVVNVCTGVETSMLDLANTIRGVVGKSPDLELSPRLRCEPKRSVGSTRRMNEILGLTEPQRLDQGIGGTHAWLANAIQRRQAAEAATVVPAR